MRITQLLNYKDKAVANHFVINTKSGEYLQSYTSIVARVVGDEVTLGKDWDYSPTTLRHLKHFLNISESKQEIQNKIDLGEYQIDYDLDYK